MRRDIRVWYESCGNGCHGDEEVRTEVCAQTGDEACCCCERDLLFDVEVKAIELVDCGYGVKGDVVCFKLARVSREGQTTSRYARSHRLHPGARTCPLLRRPAYPAPSRHYLAASLLHPIADRTAYHRGGGR